VSGTDSAFTLAAAGDAIITQRLASSDDDRLADLLDPVRTADASFVNLEVLLHDYEGYPAARSGGTYMRAPGWVADELADAGFDLLAAANNHTGDYSHGGMEATMRELESRDLPYAGLGRNLADARAPTYADTPAGRVGLVAACSTFVPGAKAGEQRPDVQGRPGLSALDLKTRYVVPEEASDRIRELSERLGLEALKERRAERGFRVPGEDEDGFTFPNIGDGDHVTFEAGEEYGVERRPDEDDAEEIRRRIRAADAQSDWVVASLHAHEGTDGAKNDDTVPAFLESFARDCIDAGADAFVSHGPHVLRGVEVYEGAPVFYSLGNFLMQNETVTKLPAEIYDRYGLDTRESLPADLFDERVFDEDGERKGFLSDRAFWETVVPVCRFGADGVERIDLYPAELGFEEPRPRRGRPRAADDEAAARILGRLAGLSEPYGTEIEIEDGCGVIRPESS
jgi:poly-gamma-glutamate synthesis protein (capsule biosynthesis protein)